VILDTIIIACNLGQQPNHNFYFYFENGQDTYQILVSTQLGGKVNQIHGLWNKVTVPIPRPKMVYITPIMMTQTNRYMGWPPSILILYINSLRACVRPSVTRRFRVLIRRRNRPGQSDSENGIRPGQSDSVCASVCDHWTQRKVTVDAEKSDGKKIRRP
jgi:hypothetical protein